MSASVDQIIGLGPRYLSFWTADIPKLKSPRTDTLDSGIDVAPGINIAPGTSGKNIKRSP